MNKILSVIVALIMILGITACAPFQSENKSENTAAQTNENGENVSENADLQSEPSETSLSFKSMNPIDKSLNLTEEQAGVIAFYNENCIPVNTPDELLRKPEAFSGLRIEFTLYVQRILESDNDSFTILGIIVENFVKFSAMATDFTRSIVVTASGQEKQFAVGDYIDCEGVYSEAQKYTVDDSTLLLPTVELFGVASAGGSADHDRRIEKVAKNLFGEKVKLRNSVEGVDYTDDDFHGHSDFKVAEMPEDCKIKSFEIFGESKKIARTDIEKRTRTKLMPSVDFENYFLITQTDEIKHIKIEYASHDMTTIWSKDVEDSDDLIFDYNKTSFAYIDGGDLHILNIKNGKDSIKPVYIGERNDLVMLPDGGVALVGEGGINNVIKINNKGEIEWKVSLPSRVMSCSGIQAAADSSIRVAVYDNGSTVNLYSVTADGVASDAAAVCYKPNY